MIAAAEKHVPGLSSHIVYRADASPVTYARYAWTSAGTIYGLSQDGRLRGAKSPVRGLVVAGSALPMAPVSKRPSFPAYARPTLSFRALLRERRTVMEMLANRSEPNSRLRNVVISACTPNQNGNFEIPVHLRSDKRQSGGFGPSRRASRSVYLH